MARFFETWADQRIHAALPACFARFDTTDQWRTLFAAIDLFLWIAHEVALRLQYPEPDERQQHIFETIRQLHAGEAL